MLTVMAGSCKRLTILGIVLVEYFVIGDWKRNNLMTKRF